MIRLAPSSFVSMVLVICSIALFQRAFADQPPAANQPESTTTDASESDFRIELIRGKVVWLADALESEFGISTVPEVRENSLAILTDSGELVPIVENLRGRAFRKDERLRSKEMEILARRYKKQPLIQILRIYEIQDGRRYEVDYWCDVCAIIMFETGPCSCCQAENRLRKTLVENEDLQRWLPAEQSVPE